MSSLIKGPLDGAAAVRGPAVAFADPPIFDPIALDAHNASVREHRRCRVARCPLCKHASDKGPIEAVSPASIGREPIAAAMTAAPPSIREPADADDRGPARTWGSWQAPPRRRRNITSTARLPGAGKVHLTIDLDDSGQPCAIWVEVHKEGSIVRGMLDAAAALASQGLQHGASIHEVAGRMIGVRFEPDGAVEGHETVKRCLSIVDLLGRMIEAEFPRTAARRAGGGE